MILQTRIEELTRDIESGQKNLQDTLKELLTIIDEAEDKCLAEVRARDEYWEGCKDDDEESYDELVEELEDGRDKICELNKYNYELEEELEEERDKNCELRQRNHELELKICEHIRES